MWVSHPHLFRTRALVANGTLTRLILRGSAYA